MPQVILSAINSAMTSRRARIAAKTTKSFREGTIKKAAQVEAAAKGAEAQATEAGRKEKIRRLRARTRTSIAGKTVAPETEQKTLLGN